MKICVVLVGQPRSFQQCAISLRRWFETNIRPLDRIYYFSVFWNYDNTHEPARGGTETFVWDDKELQEAIEQSYSKEHLLTSKIVTVYDAHKYLGGLGFTPEQILYSYYDWYSFCRCRTMHQIWLFKYAADLFEKYIDQHNLECDVVLFTRPDAVFLGTEYLDYDNLERNIQYVKSHFSEFVDKIVGFNDEEVIVRNIRLVESNDTVSYPNFGWLDDRFVVGFQKPVISFFREVWKQFVDHLERGFEEGEQGVVVFPEELWFQALVCGKFRMLNMFEPQTVNTTLLRNWTKKYPEFLQSIQNGTLSNLIDDYSRYKKDAFHFSTEQDWKEYCQSRFSKSKNKCTKRDESYLI